MSKYWMLHCKTCDAVPPDMDGINHGQHILRSIYALRDHILAIDEQDKSGYLSVELMAHGSMGLWSFLREHYEHEMDLLSEYGDTEPIEEEKPPTQVGGIIDDRPFLIMHEFDPSKELMFIPKNASIYPSISLNEQETLWEIAQTLTEQEPTYPVDVDINDVPYNWCCPFCNGISTNWVERDTFPHEPTCIVTKARDLLRARKEREADTPKIVVKINGEAQE